MTISSLALIPVTVFAAYKRLSEFWRNKEGMSDACFENHDFAKAGDGAKQCGCLFNTVMVTAPQRLFLYF